MRKVLVAFDGSDSAKRALQYVIDFARMHEATLEVHLLNVQHAAVLYGEYVNDEMIANMRQSQQQQALESLAWPAAQLEAAGMACQKHTAFGNVAEQVNIAVRKLQCDTVVMGTRGLGNFTGLLLGSVATRVIHEVQVPVLLVK
ncbi:universal stress protein [Pseudomonas lalucatii]|uniref:Universal stress protein n=1 Tax=Pseudomonas lalucatii TaxID=1424203 RepID=A0ABS5Q335_9PSED|nr:universal stress protein [Pseudomonas lalucatii]MBS7663180.1 universal stress protein [Pseudomonas lalucatii]MBS7689978.1 universal stress protein [Pseudomonas lalucatii]MBS7724870.1 universal stress protein [Pseudomonas lalucatii]QVM87155.1 universal stress protein [Pseudomonas lalucatii]